MKRLLIVGMLTLACAPAPPVPAFELHPAEPDYGAPGIGAHDLGPAPLDACPAALRVPLPGQGAPPAMPAPPDWPPREPVACANGRDDDGDGLVDWPADPGCLVAGGLDEAAGERAPEVGGLGMPACANGRDDDDDGRIDWPRDPQCAAAGERSELLRCAAGPVVPLPGDAGSVVLPIGGQETDAPRPTGCVGALGSGVVLYSRRAAPSSLSLRVSEAFSYRGTPLESTRIVVTTACDDPEAVVLCADGPAVRVPRLPAGPVMVVIHGPGAVGDDSPRPAAPDWRVSWRFEPPAPGGCDDGQDDDLDGLVDAADPGCRDAADPFEHDPAVSPACADGRDGDGDGLTDWPDDPDCAAAGDGSEAGCGPGVPVFEIGDRVPFADLPESAPTDCRDGPWRAIRVAATPRSRARVRVVGAGDADVRIAVALAPGCALDGPAACGYGVREPSGWIDADGVEVWHVALEGATRPEAAVVEVVAAHAPGGIGDDGSACANGLDDDGDGLIDVADPGCASAADRGEVDPVVPPMPACANGLDDDGDGEIDWPADADCFAAGDPHEGPLDCAGGPIGPVVDASGGAIAIGPQVGDEVRGSCQPADERTPEVAVPLTLRRSARVTVSGGGVAAVHVRADCGRAETEVRCALGDPPLGAPLVLPAGRWTLFVEASPGSRRDVVLEVQPLAACADGLDGDADGRIDLADPGCSDPLDGDERDPEDGPAACGNGLDDDGDGQVDWPADVECAGRGAASEDGWRGRPVIHAGGALDSAEVELPRSPPLPSLAPRPDGMAVPQTVVEVDVGPRDVLRVLAGRPLPSRVLKLGDAGEEPAVLTLMDHERRFVPEAPGLVRLLIEWFDDTPGPRRLPFERIRGLGACADAIDNDGDGLIDRADPGCLSDADTGEYDPMAPPTCADGIDDDGDGRVDWPDDPQCRAAGDDAEGLLCPGRAAGSIGPGGGRVVVRPGPLSREPWASRCSSWRPQTAARVVRVQVDRPSRLVATTAHGPMDLRLSLRCDCHRADRLDPGGLAPTGEVACAVGDDPFDGPRLEVPALDPGSYALVIDGWDDPGAAAVLDVALTPL